MEYRFFILLMIVDCGYAHNPYVDVGTDSEFRISLSAGSALLKAQKILRRKPTMDYGKIYPTRSRVKSIRAKLVDID